jgi:pyruvate kinase
MRRAKIVATLGPASSTPEMIQTLVAAGMDVARINFSHGTHDEHRATYENVRRAAEKAGRPIAVLQDLQGPKIRIGRLKGGKFLLKEGSEVTITTDLAAAADSFKIPCTYGGLTGDVQRGDPILLADGTMRLEVLAVSKREVQCRVVVGGVLTDNKGINLPGTVVALPALTAKDLDDLLFGLTLGVDYVAASFVRSADDVRDVRRHAGSLPIIAKIEKPQAVDRLDEICLAADGIMIARGDLGVEMPLERVPLIQKTAIEKINRFGKTAIVATQMLESMITNPAPTRAEVSDVANAILDGTDAVMLSAESASGAHPAAAVRTMASIIEEVERSERFMMRPAVELLTSDGTFATAVSRAATAAATQLNIRTIVCYTRTGETARLLAEFRPRANIIAFTPRKDSYYRMGLHWGVQARMVDPFHSTDEMLAKISAQLIATGDARRGEAVVICSAVPPDRPTIGASMMQLLRL